MCQRCQAPKPGGVESGINQQLQGPSWGAGWEILHRASGLGCVVRTARAGERQAPQALAAAPFVPVGCQLPLPDSP